MNNDKPLKPIKPLDMVNAIYRAGYTVDSDLYPLLLNLEPNLEKKFSERLTDVMELSLELEKKSEMADLERDIQGLFNYFYLDIKEKKDVVHVYDDFKTLVYSCSASMLKDAYSKCTVTARDAVRSHLIEKKIMKPMDILVV